jgi:hypothetical protein
MINKAKIFLVTNDEENLTPMIETEYKSEDILQVLLAKYPDLLPGDQISPEDPRRWLLVSREMGVPGDTDETGRWSLDHLFLDQDGIPTFVECKRSTDTRTRREVVAQMLDYAANGTEYWSMDRIRQAAAETARNRGRLLNDEVMEITGIEDEEGVEIYWESVEENLKQGKVRLIFVADKTPRELRRLVEFLNEKMVDVEVLAVEIKQYLGEGQKAIVPRVIGLTEATRTPPGKQHTTREEFLSKCTPEAANIFEQVLDKALNEKHKIYWGKLGFSTRVYLPTEDRFATFLLCFPPSTFEFFFGPFPITEDEKGLLRNDLLNFGIFQEAGEKTLRAILDDDALSTINEVIDFIFMNVDEFKKGDNSGI